MLPAVTDLSTDAGPGKVRTGKIQMIMVLEIFVEEVKEALAFNTPRSFAYFEQSCILHGAV
jgi:hypothetical protein